MAILNYLKYEVVGVELYLNHWLLKSDVYAFVTQLGKWHAKKGTFQKLHVGLCEQKILHVI